MRKRLNSISFNLRAILNNVNSKKLIFFVLVFTIVKGLVFYAPLAISNVINNSTKYGELEYTINLGNLLVNFMVFGLHGAYPYYNLKLKKEGYHSIFYFHSFVILILCVLTYFLFYITWVLTHQIILSILIGFIFSLQQILSSIQKSHNKIIFAVIIDGGIYLVLTLVYLTIKIFHFQYDFYLLLLFLLMYAIFILSIFIKNFILFHKDFNLKRYKESLKFGLPLIISSFTTIALLGSTRIYIEYFLSNEDVAYYSFYFRLATAVVMIHQVLNIAFFKKIYEAVPETLDKYFSIFICIISLLSIISYLIIPSFLLPYFAIMQESYATMKPLYFILSIHVIFWICNALNENIIIRENLAKDFNKSITVIIITMIFTMWGLSKFGYLNIYTLTITNMVAIFCSNEIQFILLKNKRNINFVKTRLVCYCLVIFFLIIYFFIK